MSFEKNEKQKNRKTEKQKNRKTEKQLSVIKEISPYASAFNQAHHTKLIPIPESSVSYLHLKTNKHLQINL